MIVQKYEEMLQGKSVIRTLSEKATKIGEEIGYDNVFDFSLGNPSVPAPAEFTKAMQDLLTNEDPVALHGYSPTLGIPWVKKAIADSLNRRFGMNYEAEHIFPTSGAAGAISHALRLVTEPGDEVITFAPFFPEYIPYVNLTGAHLKVVQSREDFQIDFDALEEAFTEKTMALLVNTPNNPTGVVYSEETLQTLAKFLENKQNKYGHSIFLISDEPYREIVYGGQPIHFVAKYYANTLTCYSFSKSLSLPGERIGYLAVAPTCEKAKTLVQMCGQISRGIGHNCPSSIMQMAVAKVIDLTSDLSVYERNANLIYETMRDVGLTCQKPDGTFYIFPKAPITDATEFAMTALKYNLVLVPSDSFGRPGYVRLAYCVGEEKVARAMQAFREMMAKEKFC